MDAILHFCCNETLIRIKSYHFSSGPNREPVRGDSQDPSAQQQLRQVSDADGGARESV